MRTAPHASRYSFVLPSPRAKLLADLFQHGPQLRLPPQHSLSAGGALLLSEYCFPPRPLAIKHHAYGRHGAWVITFAELTGIRLIPGPGDSLLSPPAPRPLRKMCGSLGTTRIFPPSTDVVFASHPDRGNAHADDLEDVWTRFAGSTRMRWPDLSPNLT